jgi:beta-barrel assembly-enhancing protease
VTLGAVAAGVLLESSGADDTTKMVAPLVIQVGGQSLVLQYSRGQESEADALGVRYMVRDGYDPRAQVEVMEILKGAMEGDRAPEFFSTHPYPETRIKRLNEMLAREYAYTQGNPQFRRGEAEFRSRFLSKLSAAYPKAGEPRLARSVEELDSMGGRGDLAMVGLCSE